MKIAGKKHIEFPVMILLLMAALVSKKLALPFSPIIFTIVFDAVAVFFFLRIFFVSRKDDNGHYQLGMHINILPVVFCVSTMAILTRFNNWRGEKMWTIVALALLVLLAATVTFILKKKPLRDQNKKLNFYFANLLPWIFFITIISLSFFSNPRQFHNLFNGTTYEQYVRQHYSLKEGTELIEKHKPHDAKSAADASDYFSKAKEAESKEDYDEALRFYNKSIDLNPDDAEAIYWRGMLKLTRLELSPDMAGEAIRDFTRVIELNPDYARAYYHRAVAKDYLTHGNNPEAKKDFMKAASLDSTLKNESEKVSR